MTQAGPFDVVLTPHRSLAPRGFLLLMTSLGLLSFAGGLTFFLLGAWPVVGFLGLDVALVWFAFRLNYRHAQQWQRVTIRDGQIAVETIDVYGRRTLWRAPTAWLRVELPEPVEPSSRLTLRSHGRRIEFGGFLAPNERAELAAALRAALRGG